MDSVKLPSGENDGRWTAATWVLLQNGRKYLRCIRLAQACTRSGKAHPLLLVDRSVYAAKRQPQSTLHTLCCFLRACSSTQVATELCMSEPCLGYFVSPSLSKCFPPSIALAVLMLVPQEQFPSCHGRFRRDLTADGERP